MDLELLLRACWRRRLQLLAAALVGAVLVAGAGGLLLSKKYASSSDLAVIAVFAGNTTNDPAAQVYTLQPDRYVLTQVEVLSSRGTAERVAKALKITTDEVAASLSVSQVGKSDVIRVSAATGDPNLSAKIVNNLVTDYLEGAANSTKAAYEDAVKSIEAQRATLSGQILKTRRDVAASGDVSTSPGPLEQRLSDLLAQDSQLVSQRQELETRHQAQPTSATIVSTATPNATPIGAGRLTLAVYGAALGMAIAFSVIATANRPGQTLDDLDAVSEFEGTPMLGVITSHQRRPIPGIPEPPPIENLRNMAVADTLSNMVERKGFVQFIVIGRPVETRRLKRSLAPLVFGPVVTNVVDPVSNTVIPRRRPADVGEFTVLSLATFLPGQTAPGSVVVGVDLARVSRPQLEDVLSGLAGIGAEVLGIVGIR